MINLNFIFFAKNSGLTASMGSHHYDNYSNPSIQSGSSQYMVNPNLKYTQTPLGQSQVNITAYGQHAMQQYGQPVIQPYGQQVMLPYGQPAMQSYGQ